MYTNSTIGIPGIEFEYVDRFLSGIENNGRA